MARYEVSEIKMKALDSVVAGNTYSDRIHTAAHESQVLLSLRAGKTHAAIQRLEHVIDMKLLMASTETNADARTIVDGPWQELKADRETHPRARTSNQEARISRMLDQLITEEPQPAH